MGIFRSIRHVFTLEKNISTPSQYRSAAEILRKELKKEGSIPCVCDRRSRIADSVEQLTEELQEFGRGLGNVQEQTREWNTAIEKVAVSQHVLSGQRTSFQRALDEKKARSRKILEKYDSLTITSYKEIKNSTSRLREEVLTLEEDLMHLHRDISDVAIDDTETQIEKLFADRCGLMNTHDRLCDTHTQLTESCEEQLTSITAISEELSHMRKPFADFYQRFQAPDQQYQIACTQIDHVLQYEKIAEDWEVLHKECEESCQHTREQLDLIDTQLDLFNQLKKVLLAQQKALTQFQKALRKITPDDSALKEAQSNCALFSQARQTYCKEIAELLSQLSSSRKRLDDMDAFADQATALSEYFLKKGLSLNERQLTAILREEPITRINFGTDEERILTLVCKVYYLTGQKGIAGDQILFLAANRQAAHMAATQLETLSIPNVSVKLFSDLGVEILQKHVISGRQKIIDCEGMEASFCKLVEETIAETCEQDEVFARSFLDYSLLYQWKPRSRYEFGSFEEYDDMLRKLDDSTVKNALESMVNAYGNTPSDSVKSYEEWCIANYLFLNGIPYVSEPAFPEPVTDPYTNRSYQPDFYLPSVRIYWEHFGLDANGQARFLSGNDRQRYEDAVTEKRKIYADCGRKLIETCSGDFEQGMLYQNLDHLLEMHGIKRQPVYASQIIATLFKTRRCVPFQQAVEKLTKDLVTCKSRSMNAADLTAEKNKPMAGLDSFDKKQRELYYVVLERLYQEYTDMLARKHILDSIDVVVSAASQIREKKAETNYSYILVAEGDGLAEYQNQMLMALTRQIDRET